VPTPRVPHGEQLLDVTGRFGAELCPARAVVRIVPHSLRAWKRISLRDGSISIDVVMYPAGRMDRTDAPWRSSEWVRISNGFDAPLGPNTRFDATQ